MASTRTPEAEPLLTPSEVATMFRVDPKTVTRWAKAGKLTSIRTLGGHRRYRETEVRALLASCGLDFDPVCLAFYETERAVRTPSSEQVRRPIFREGTEAWKPFAPWLDPLETALGPVLPSYPDAPAAW